MEKDSLHYTSFLIFSVELLYFPIYYNK